ncbi:MAG: hypothetical protein JWM80_1282 [Cyanobacteria bacterium RYN_339]|nr:hypothetical protein [Cyanobacteria bacterium RYN_339]
MRALAALLLMVTLAGCHAVPSAPVAARARVAQHAAIRDTGDVLVDAAQAAHADLDAIDAAFHTLSLDTAAGRKLTPARAKSLTTGLVPLLQQLDLDTAAIATRLAGANTPAATAALAEFDKHHPLAGEVLGPDATASDMLYRITQYRLKLAALVELQLRQGNDPPAPVAATT